MWMMLLRHYSLSLKDFSNGLHETFKMSTSEQSETGICVFMIKQNNCGMLKLFVKKKTTN